MGDEFVSDILGGVTMTVNKNDLRESLNIKCLQVIASPWFTDYSKNIIVKIFRDEINGIN